MASRIIRWLRDLQDVDTTGVSDGDALVYDDATETWIPGAGGGGGGAPTTVDYLVGTASGDLSAEIVVGTSPGGELGGSWASPTVDASHSGSTHAAVQAAAEATAAAALAAHTGDTSDAHDASAISSVAAGNLAATDVQAALNELDSEKAAATHAHAGEDITSGTVADARIASTIARDSEVTSAISTSEAGQVRDGDAAGGVLGGTYPNPSFAADMATQAELDAHTGDTSAAHAASAISADSTTLVGTGTDVQAVLEELDNGIADHLADSSAAHAASAISFSPQGSIAATDVQAAIQEVRDEASGIAATIFDAKGDIIAATAADTAARLAVGSVNGQVLGVASGESTGLKWIYEKGHQLDYVERTSNLTVSATTAAGANDLIVGNSVAYDGSTRVLIEVFCAIADARQFVILSLWDGSTDLGTIASFSSNNVATMGSSLHGMRFLTPSNASHTYTIKAWRGGTGATVYAASGGTAGEYLPAFLRITVA